MRWNLNSSVKDLNLNILKTESDEYGCGLYRDIDQRYLVTPSGHN